MSLSDHLRELRYRVVISALASAVATVVAAFFYRQLYDLLLRPYQTGIALLAIHHPDAKIAAYNNGFAAPFVLWLKLCGLAGVMASCPVWLYHAWAFVMPGLHTHERRWAIRFLLAAAPLFLLGMAVGYWTLPQAIAAMLAFTPDAVPVSNLIDLNSFLDLIIMTMSIFGLSFLLPVFLVTLNLAGVVSGAQLAKARPYSVFGAFVIGAAATPSTDPFSMLALAIPLALLYLAAELLCRLHDHRHSRETP